MSSNFKDYSMGFSFLTRAVILYSILWLPVSGVQNRVQNFCNRILPTENFALNSRGASKWSKYCCKHSHIVLLCSPPPSLSLSLQFYLQFWCRPTCSWKLLPVSLPSKKRCCQTMSSCHQEIHLDSFQVSKTCHNTHTHTYIHTCISKLQNYKEQQASYA